MQNNAQVEKPIVPGYGTKEEPLSIDQARAKVREDFLKLAELVMSQVSLPPRQPLDWKVNYVGQAAKWKPRSMG
jgi:hypothetical protein